VRSASPRLTSHLSVAAWKTPLRGREGALPAFVSADVFNSPDNPTQPGPATKQFIVAAQQLFNATAARSVSTTWETVPVQVYTSLKS
jgi:hypothetical protein